MAIGKLLPRTAPPLRSLAYRLDRRCTAGELGHLVGLGCKRRSVLKLFRGLVTPPLPFAEAELKADPNGVKHNTVLCKLRTTQIGLFARSPARLRFGRLKPEPAGAALAERLFQLGQDCFEFARQRPRWIDDQKTCRGEGVPDGLRRDAELQTQAFSGRRAGADSLRDMPRKAVGGAAAFHRIPQQIAAGRPFRERFREACGEPFGLVLLRVRRIDQDQATALLWRHEG